jgi:hypothetical protein
MTYASLYCKAFKSPPSGVGEPEQCSVSIYCGFSVGCCRQRCPLRSNCRHKHEQGNCRARALGPRLPREKWAHLRDHAKERRISQVDLFALAAEDPDVPDVRYRQTPQRILVGGAGSAREAAVAAAPRLLLSRSSSPNRSRKLRTM